MFMSNRSPWRTERKRLDSQMIEISKVASLLELAAKSWHESARQNINYEYQSIRCFQQDMFEYVAQMKPPY